MSLVICQEPTGKIEECIKLPLSKIATEVLSWPKSKCTKPFSNSS